MQEHQIIRCMLLPLESGFLLLPNVSVAEVIAYVEPNKGTYQNEVLMGSIDWRGIIVPILSFEKACGIKSGEKSSRDRVAIIYNPNGDKDKPYLGVKLKDIPRAFNATAETLEHDLKNESLQLVKYQITHNDERVLIPDIDGLFELI